MVEEKKVVEEKSIPLYVVLSLLTCALFGIYWFYFSIADDIKELKGGDEPKGVQDLLLSLVTCGIYGLYCMYQYPKHIVDIQKAKGKEENDISVMALVLCFVPLGYYISISMIQNELNKLAVPKPE